MLELKKMVKKHVQNVAFSELVAKQKLGKKGCEIKYGEKLEMADYLLPKKKKKKNLKNKEKFLKFVQDKQNALKLGKTNPL